MLLVLPTDLQLQIAGFLTDLGDCAALCIAAPRLGLAALRHRELPQYKNILLSVALRLVADGDRGSAPGVSFHINEALLRRYLWDARMTAAGCEWLTAQLSEPLGPFGIMTSWNHGTELHHLTEDGVTRALVRSKTPRGVIRFYEGDVGVERLVGMEYPNGFYQNYEGEHGAERMTSSKIPGGCTSYFDGDMGFERLVGKEYPNGFHQNYEGERGEERKWSSVWTGGPWAYFEGARGEERLTAEYWPDGSHQCYKGERGAERMVSRTHAGGVEFFEGEKGTERLVRRTRLVHCDPEFVEEMFDGEADVERMVRRRVSRARGAEPYKEEVWEGESGEAAEWERW